MMVVMANTIERIVECRECGAATRPRKCGSHRCGPCESARVKAWLDRQPPETEPKECTRCREVKPVREFVSAGRGRYKSICKPCRQATRKVTPSEVAYRERRKALERERYASDPDYRAFRLDAERARRYGLTPLQIEQMLKDQGGRCAICRTDNPGKRFWHVDHDHSCCPKIRSCGKCVRGLLCHNCNVGLGAFKDNPRSLIAAAEYLEAHSG